MISVKRPQVQVAVWVLAKFEFWHVGSSPSLTNMFSKGTLYLKRRKKYQVITMYDLLWLPIQINLKKIGKLGKGKY